MPRLTRREEPTPLKGAYDISIGCWTKRYFTPRRADVIVAIVLSTLVR
jgi:hypothetical protein